MATLSESNKIVCFSFFFSLTNPKDRFSFSSCLVESTRMGSEGCGTDPKANVCCKKKKQEKALVKIVRTLEICCHEIASSTQLFKSLFHVVRQLKHHRRQR